MLTYTEAKEKLQRWYRGEDVSFSPEFLDCCYVAILKQNPIEVIKYGDDESDDVLCPRCHALLGSNEMVWEDFHDRKWAPMHCRECGQSIVWKEAKQ